MKTALITLSIAATLIVTACSNQTAHPPAKVSGEHRVLLDAAQTIYRLENKQDPSARTGLSEATRPQIIEHTAAAASAPTTVRNKQAAEVFEAFQPQDQSQSVAKAYPLNMAAILPANEPIDRENYLQFEENGVNLAIEHPVSTFSIDVDTAAYSNIRRMLMQEGRLPPRDAVKIEELLNYFSYDYPSSESIDAPFSVNTEMAPTPWHPGKHLLQIGIKGYKPDPQLRPRANLVFLIDVSGSMQDSNKLGLVKRSLNLLVEELDPMDRIAMVVYAGAAGIVLESTPISQKHRIKQGINSLKAGGSTNGGAGIRLAYDIAEANLIKNGINRVIIASDGDMNVGTVNHEALKNLVQLRRESGISLTTLGYGTGNYNYALMEQLADVGNGNAAYIDNIREAQKVLVDEMLSTLLTIAKDVKIQIEFNPNVVSEYRLIGYENRMLNREDFRNDKVDAGEIGAGHTVTALYEVVMTNSNDKLISDLRYTQLNSSTVKSSEHQGPQSEIAFVRLRYKKPDQSSSSEFGQPVYLSTIKKDMNSASGNLRFAAAVAGFGQLLRGGKFTGNWNYNHAIKLANEARGIDPYGYRSEFISMVRLANTYAPALVHIDG